MPDEVVDNTGGSSSLPTSSGEASAAAPALTNPTAVVSGPSDVSDDDLLSALNASRAGKEAAPEADIPTPSASSSSSSDSGASSPTPEKKTDAAPVDPKIAAQVEAAVKARAEQAEARERELRQYRDQGSRIVQEAEAYREQVRREVEAQKAAELAEFRRDPLAFAKKANWDPVELVDNIAKYDTPEGRMQRELVAQRAELAQLRAEQKARDDAAARATQTQQQQAQTREVETAFLGELKTKYPGVEEHLKRPGMQEFYIQQAHKRANELAGDPARAGQPLTYGEVAEWLGTTYGFAQAPTPPKGAPAQTAAGKPARGLTQTAQSERSGGDGRKFHELSEAEQDAILVAEQRERSRQRQAQR